MNKEDSFYMDTLEKTQPETFDFINHLSEQCHSELSFASHEINNQLSFIRSSYQLISKKAPGNQRLSVLGRTGRCCKPHHFLYGTHRSVPL